MSSQFTPIDLVEVAYDLQIDVDDWVPRLLKVGRPMLAQGLGVVAKVLSGFEPGQEQKVIGMYVDGGAPDLAVRAARALQAVPVGEELSATICCCGARTISESSRSYPDVVESVTRCYGAKDVLGFWALDPDFSGLSFVAPLPEVSSLTPKERVRWSMLAAHVTAGHRLRQNLWDPKNAGVPISELPLRAEAILDPKRFRVTEAVGEAQDPASSTRLREQALQVDRARGRLRRRDPDEALEIWKGLVAGRWSMVDWFDTDGRRFILAKPNPPHLPDPRGLTERETQVAYYATCGDSHKIIAYRLGISRTSVTNLLRSVKRKLGMKTQAELVAVLSPLWRGSGAPNLGTGSQSGSFEGTLASSEPR